MDKSNAEACYILAMDAPEEIKTRLDIVDLIGEYLPLKPAGSGAFKACCPFHQEKTPSFYVSRTRQSWHCFGCDTGGDQFTFVEQMEGLDFREALELLAAKTGVELPKFDGEKATHRKRLYEINDMAVRFYRAALATRADAEHAREYLKKRGLDHLTEDLFKLGYAPAGWSTLAEALQAKGVTSEELVRVGLCAARTGGSGVYDRFRGRIMFPIFDVHGNPVGFTSRILADDVKEAKYVNTPETPIYKKAAVLYGLDKAKGEVRQKDLAVIVEGNMDVIASHQFSIGNVVASSGTALTGEQLSLIKRFTTNLAIAFDADVAGQAATLRGLDLARGQDFSIKIITLPEGAGKDPDDAVRKDPKIWEEVIKNAVSIMEWIYRQAFKHHRGQQAEDKKLIARELMPEIKRISDPVERDHWMKKLAQDLAVSEDALREVLGRVPNVVPSRTGPVAKKVEQDSLRQAADRGKDKMDPLEERLFALLVAKPETLLHGMRESAIKAEEFTDPALQALYGVLIKEYSPDIQLSSAPRSSAAAIRLPADLTPEQTMLFHRLAFLAERESEGQTLDMLVRELASACVLWRDKSRGRRRRQLEQEMREAQLAGDKAKEDEIVARFSDIK